MEKAKRNEIDDRMALEFQRGSQFALKYFFTQLHAALSFYAFGWMKDRRLAEEIAADAFIKTWKFHAKLSTPAAIRSYLYTVVKRDAMRQARTLEKTVPLSTISTDAINESYDALVRAETMCMLQQAIGDLAPATREVIEKYFIQNMSTGEIAKALRLHPSTVKTQKTRGIAILKKRLNPSIFF